MADRAQYFKEWHRLQTEAKRAVYLAYKDRPCSDCGGRFPEYVMEFDHPPGTKDEKMRRRGVSSLVAGTTPIDVMVDAIKKCDLVCANCHRIRTHKRGQTGRRW